MTYRLGNTRITIRAVGLAFATRRCMVSQAVSLDRPTGAARSLRLARAVLRRSGVELPACPEGTATALMDLYRRTRRDSVFEALIGLTRDQLLARVRARSGFLGARVDAEELLQDAVINIYRYPARFDASRPGAFRAWSSVIVDNAVRRHMRNLATGPDIRLQPTELLAEEPDRQHGGPSERAIAAESRDRCASAFRLVLSYYLVAFGGLKEREQIVLQKVEVEGARYAEVGQALGMRPDALKMVVFRARRRVLSRMAAMMATAARGRDATMQLVSTRPFRAAV